MAKNTIIYSSHYELMSSLSNEQAGILIKAIGTYSQGEQPVIEDMLVKGIFLAIKRDFDVQEENYQKKVKANRENGKKGGRPKEPTLTEENPNNPMGFLETQENPQNLKDKDKDKDKDIDKDDLPLTNSYNSNSISSETRRVNTFFVIRDKTILTEEEFDKQLQNI